MTHPMFPLGLELPLEKFKSLRILVVGDVMLDRYLWGKTERISPEAPVPVVEVEKEEERLGGAANVALNLSSLGARVSLCGLIGGDETGDRLRALTLAHGIDLSQGLLELTDRRTTLKTRVLAQGQHLLRIDAEDRHYPGKAEAHLLAMRWGQKIADADAVILQDYNKGALPEQVIAHLITLASEKGVPILADPKRQHLGAYKGATVFKPNFREFSAMMDYPLSTDDLTAVRAAAAMLAQKQGHQQVVVTLGSRGMIWVEPNENYVYWPAHRREIADVSGAGDTVIALLALAYACKLSPRHCLWLANLGGGLVCEYPGVVPVTPGMLLEGLKRDADAPIEGISRPFF